MLLNRALHPLLQLAYRLQLAWWSVWHPSLRGAAVAVWHEGRVLMIRNSYRRSLTFPAGAVGRLESDREAAARELREEVGISVATGSLDYVGEFVEINGYVNDHVHLYALHCREAPRVRVDGREVVWAEFLEPRVALERGAVGIYRCYLTSTLPGA